MKYRSLASSTPGPNRQGCEDSLDRRPTRFEWRGLFASFLMIAVSTVFVVGQWSEAVAVGPSALARDAVAAANLGSAASGSLSGASGATIDTIVTQADGKILIGGDFSSWNGAAASGLVRLNSDFTVDTAFLANVASAPTDDTAFYPVRAIRPLADGDIWIGGEFSSWAGNVAKGLVRLNSDGTFDAGYTQWPSAANSSAKIWSIDVQSTGNLIVTFAKASSFHPNGSSNCTPDSTCNMGRITVSGTTLAKDDAFLVNSGNANTGNRLMVKVLSDDSILLSGAFASLSGTAGGASGTGRGLIKFNADGTRDVTFNSNVNTAANISATSRVTLGVQSDGKIVVAGDFSASAAAATASKILRFNADGTIDSSFIANIGGSNGGFACVGTGCATVKPSSLVILPNDEILVGGNFSAFGGTANSNLIGPGLALLNADGTLKSGLNRAKNDGNFAISSSYTGVKYARSGAHEANTVKNVTAVAVSSTGQVIAGGDFKHWANTGCESGSPTTSATESCETNVGRMVVLNVVPAPTLTPSTQSVAGMVNTAITPTAALTPANFTGAVTYVLTAGTLPTGLSLDATSGVVSGTPTAVFTPSTSNSPIEITGYGQTFGIATSLVTFSVTSLTPATRTVTGTVNTAISATTGYTASGFSGSVSYAVTSGTLPAGLTLSPTNGAISGTPTSVSSATVTITATGATSGVATTSVIFDIGVRTISPATQTISGPTGRAITASTAFTHSYFAGLTPTYSVPAGSLPSGLIINSSTGVISGTPSVASTATVTVTATASGGTATATVTFDIGPPAVSPSTQTLQGSVGAAITPSTAFTATKFTGSVSYAVTSGSLPAGLSLSPSTGEITGTPSVVSSATVTITATGATAGSATATVTFAIILQSISPATQTVTGTAGTAITPSASYTPTGLTGLVSYAVTSGSLPAGLSLSSSTGVISGTPSVASSATVTVTATGATAGSVTATVTFAIVAASLSPSTQTVPGTAGTAITPSVAFTESDFTGLVSYAVTSGSLPAGLSLSSATGVISGTPSVASSATVTVTATGATAGTATATVTFAIVAAATTTTAPPNSSAPTTTVPAGPSLVNASNQPTLTQQPGSATAIVNGQVVTPTIETPADLPAAQIDPEDRTPAQVQSLQTVADDLVGQLNQSAGGNSGLSVQDTPTGANINGLLDVPVPIENTVYVEAGTKSTLFAAVNEDGTVTEVQPGAVIEVLGNGEVGVAAFGLTPNENVEFVLMSTPTLLGTYTVNADGTVKAQAPLPTTVGDGNHTLVVASPSVQASLGLKIAPATATVLPTTGTDPWSGSAVAALWLVVLGSIVGYSRRRRLV